MKAEFDKEIDALLRESARRGRAASGERRARADDAHVTTTAHLDADEQSAYAENALPAAARAHYMAHLADCDDCRRSVTRLALAAGMPAQLETREATTGQVVVAPHAAGWRARLGALLAPRAWRYAVPALALLLVGAVALIVLTRPPREGLSSIAQRNTAETKRSETAQTETHHATQNDNGATTATAPGASDGLTKTTEPNAANAPSQNAPLAKEEIAANSERAETSQPLAGTSVGAADAPPPPAPASGGGGAPTARSVSELPKPMPTPAPVVTDSVTITSEQESKIKSGETVAQMPKVEQKPGGLENRQYENRQYENRQREPISGPRRNEQAQNRRAADEDFARNRDDKKDAELAATTSPAPASPSAAAKRSRPAREADRGKDENRPAEDAKGRASAISKSVAETRSVAGRKFTRQGGAWVDAAYRAGQSYTVVRRNSEQFRALVADEPQLRRVADALGGEVTVVWKGRAYRFR
ncbi:MAG: hypothetical protein QOD32_2171 [Pyrinomonadaceae bacterium]|jgi:hypothetical protein|nr:hypothetical protein [Pyrinomonadaceae bacterium]